MKELSFVSYWDRETWFANVDFTVVGSGIVGLNCALELRQQYPDAKILILERGAWPQGASTKNAGFACFGSVSELLKDFKDHSPEDVFRLVEQRMLGLDRLRTILGDEDLDYHQYGGYELFLDKDEQLYKNCLDNIEELNALLFPFFSAPIFETTENTFGFKNTFSQLIHNSFEGQIDTGKMMRALLRKVHKANIQVLNHCEVKNFKDHTRSVDVETNLGNFSTGKLVVANNGFAKYLGIENVKPVRAQVLITKPIPNLQIQGTFHIEEGYYYFRNIHNRILFGGGRNLNFEVEETTEFGETELVQHELEKYLRTIILPDTPFEIDQRWSGIMGVGAQKNPILEKIANNVYCGVRLGGMGIAIGSIVGRDLAYLVSK